jgi:thiosulfate sulfurtransferase
MLALAAGGTVLGMTASAVRPSGLRPWEAVRATAASDQASCVAPAATPSVSVRDAVAMHRGGAAFVDLRSADVYAQGHVAGALHMPCRSATRPERMESARGRTIILYGNDQDAEWAAEALRERGFSDVRVLAGDFAAWRAAQGPAEAGACDGCTNVP